MRVTFEAPSVVPPSGIAFDAGTFDDHDETYLNGQLVGSVTPANSSPDTAWATHRLYSIPTDLLKEGANVVAIHVWNRGKDQVHPAFIRGPLIIRENSTGVSLYAGTYKHSDDPYLEHHW